MLVGFLFLISCGEQSETLKIACASNLELGMDSIVKAFQEQHDIECELVVGASGVLSAQIENEAPFDVFISADGSYTDHLFDKGISGKPKFFRSGQLVVIDLMERENQTIEGILLPNHVKSIGIADPDQAPYGKAAKTYLENNGLWERVSPKLICAESVAHLNQYIESNTLDAAITNKAFTVQSDKDYVSYDLGSGATFVEHFAVTLNEKEETQKFYDFLFSEESSEILQYFGY